MKSIVWVMAAGIAALSGCIADVGSPAIQGSGTRVSEIREVETFRGIAFRGAGELRAEAGTDQSVTIEIDDNLLELITTEVRDGRLIIDSTQRYSSQIGLTVTATAGELDYVGLAGSGNVQISGIDGSKFDFELAGAGNVQASGTAERVGVGISGSGNADMSDLVAKDVTVNITGSGGVRVHATDNLQATILGSGDITYRGSPKIERNVLGSGNISQE